MKDINYWLVRVNIMRANNGKNPIEWHKTFEGNMLKVGDEILCSGENKTFITGFVKALHYTLMQ